eukprot:gene18876-24667_t
MEYESCSSDSEIIETHFIDGPLGVTLRRRLEDGIVFVYDIVPNSQAINLDVQPNDELWAVGDSVLGLTPLDKQAWKVYLNDSIIAGYVMCYVVMIVLNVELFLMEVRSCDPCEAKDRLIERGEKLSKLSDRTADLSNQANEFARLAKQLQEQQKSSWF